MRKGGFFLRILGLDYGDSRIGVAVSDMLGITAQPMTVISEKYFVRQVQLVAEKAKELEAEEIVIGMPKHMNGTIGERGEKTITFATALKEILPIPIIYWDERLTTQAAHRTLEECSVSGKKRKGLLDKLAAVFILQGYLDSKK